MAGYREPPKAANVGEPQCAKGIVYAVLLEVCNVILDRQGIFEIEGRTDNSQHEDLAKDLYWQLGNSEKKVRLMITVCDFLGNP